MVDALLKFEECINNCLLGKLSIMTHNKDYHYHSEYQMRIGKLEQYFPELLDLVETLDFRERPEMCSTTLYSLIILFMELKTNGRWNTESLKAKDYAGKLNLAFQSKYNISLEEIFFKDDFYNAQEVFDKCIKELHQKLTESIYFYPSLVEVYCMLLANVRQYNVTVNIATVIPMALFMVDDHCPSYKAKGLQCCVWIMQCLKPDCFKTGNFYEVVFMSLRQNLYEKDIGVTKLLFECLPDFIRHLPPEAKKDTLDDLYSCLIDQLSTETNLYRKAVCFDFTTKIIEMYGVHYVKKKMLKDIICDNLELCCNEGVYDILIQHVMECLLMWISYSWCIWKLPSDHKLLSTLIKTLYVAKDETTILQIQNMILTLINLCTKEEQLQICSNLDSLPKGLNNDFLVRINTIKESICC